MFLLHNSDQFYISTIFGMHASFLKCHYYVASQRKKAAFYFSRQVISMLILCFEWAWK